MGQSVENALEDLNSVDSAMNMLPMIYLGIYDQMPTCQPPAILDLPNDVEYPNMNSTDYSKRLSNRTLRMHLIWECIALNENKHGIIATNKGHGRQWSSSLWGFESMNELNSESSVYKLQFDNHITNVQFVAENIVFVAFINGLTQLWSTHSEIRNKSNPYCLFKIDQKWEHQDAVICMDVAKNISATGGEDSVLKIWNLGGAELISTHTYRFAHLDSITGVCIFKGNDQLLSTCSTDKKALLWDLRETLPAIALYEDHNVGFTHLNWLGVSNLDTYIYIGDELGNVHMIDARIPKKFIKTQNLFDRPIRKMISNSRSNMAVIADSNAVKISTMLNNEIIYENNSSQHFIRDAAWYDDNKLLTVGCEGKMRQHNILIS